MKIVKVDGRTWCVVVEQNKIVKLWRCDRPQDKDVPFDRSSYIAKAILQKLKGE